MKILGTIFQWLVVIAFFAGIYFAVKYVHFPVLILAPAQVLFLALSIAFMWVEVLKWGSVKPFNCVKCLTGWFSLIIGCLCFGWYGILFLPCGLFIGAVFEGIKMRWL